MEYTNLMEHCTAKSKRSQERCRSYPMVGKTVCAIHGGKTPAGAALPQFKNGKHSRYQYLPPNLTTRFEALAEATVNDLDESIQMQKAIETTLAEKLNTDESPAAWKAIQKVLSQVGHREQDISPSDAIEQIETIVDGELGQSSLIAQIQSIHESQRKLAESASKIRKEQQETYTQEQWNMMMGVVLRALQKVVEPKQIQVFTDEIAVFQRKELKA